MTAVVSRDLGAERAPQRREAMAPMLLGKERVSASGPILVCDDEPLLASSLARQLRRFGVDVISDSNSDVVPVAAREHPCLVLMDVVQPRDGLDMLRELRAHELTRDIPVLVMSAVDSAQVRQQCFEAGALGFVAKPFLQDFAESLARLAQLLSTPEGRATVEGMHAFTKRADA